MTAPKHTPTSKGEAWAIELGFWDAPERQAIVRAVNAHDRLVEMLELMLASDDAHGKSNNFESGARALLAEVTK